jgi:hypothetical protein
MKIERKYLADLCSTDEQVKWSAVVHLGAQISGLAEEDMEAARNRMRRFLWQLNDECGGIGWGIPEAMGEVMARSEGLAREFAPLLLSYIKREGNYLEYGPLQRGALWGIGRLGQVRPHLLQDLGAAPHLLPFLKSPDVSLRGLAVWVAGLTGAKEAVPEIGRLLTDFSTVRIFINGQMSSLQISELAEESLLRIGAKKPPDRFHDKGQS